MENKIVEMSIDYGNSESRILLTFTDNEGCERHILSRINNFFVKLDDMDIEYLDDIFEGMPPTTSYIINVDDEYICSGKYAIKQRPSYITKPTATIKKIDNETTKWSTHNIFIRAFTILSEVLNEDINTLINSVFWELTISLPAQEVLKDRNEIKKILQNFRLNAIYPEMTGEVNISSINIVPEGFATLIACTYTIEGEKLNESLINRKTLVIDIGEGTTDLVLSDGAKNYQYNTLYTISCGGSNMKNKLRKLLADKGKVKNIFGDLFYNDLIVNNGFYYYTTGSEPLDLQKEVASVVKSISNSVCNEMINYFEGCRINADEIDNILIVGGGSIQRSKNSIYNIIKEFIKHNYKLDESKFVEPPVLEGYELYVEDKGLTTTIPEDQRRLLNVIGNAIYSLM